MTLDRRRSRQLSETIDAADRDAQEVSSTGSRRRFLLGAAAALPAAALGSSVLSFTSLAAPAAAAESVISPDIQSTTFLASLELGLAQLYKQAQSSGNLTSATNTVAGTFVGHHTQHASTLATLITAGSGNVPTAGNAGLIALYGPQVTAARTEKALVTLFGQLEESMAATYFETLGSAQSTAVSSALAAALPVEAQHAVVWSAALNPSGNPPNMPATTAIPPLQTATDQLSAQDFVIEAPTTTTTAPTTSASTTTGAKR